MDETEVILEYSGQVDYKIIDELLAGLKEKKEFTSLNKRLGKRIYAILVECLENIARHSENNLLHKNIEPFVFVRKINEEIIVKSGNPVNTERKDKLQKILETVNHMDNEELLNLYESKINNCNTGENGTGIGFMLMKLKAGAIIDYDFTGINGNLFFFGIQISLKI